MKRTMILGAACAAAIFLSLSATTSYGAEERGFLGVFLSPPAESSSVAKDGDGARVEDVARGGPAEKAGLKEGDLLLSLNGKDFEDVKGYSAIFFGLKVFLR